MGKKPVIGDAAARAMMSRSSVRVTRLLQQLQSEGHTPFEALIVAMFTLATLARGLDMPLEELQRGIAAAFVSLEVDPNGAEGEHVH